MGVVTGEAKVLKSLNDVHKLNVGDILITKATSPDWTPFIHASSGVVTELGGSLSHAAIVCREYGIPAVVGAKGATKLIKDGVKVTVYGTNGTIEY